MDDDKNWKIIMDEKTEKIFTELFLNPSNVKRIAKKYGFSKNTVKPRIINLVGEGYVENIKRIVYKNGSTLNYAKRSNLNSFFDYFEDFTRNKLSSQDRKIINFVCGPNKIRELIISLPGDNIFQKISRYLLDFCAYGLQNDFRPSHFRYKYKGSFDQIRNYFSTEYPSIGRLNFENLNFEMYKVSKLVPYFFCMKVFRLTIPFSIAHILLNEPIKQINILHNDLIKNKEKFDDMDKRMLPSTDELNLVLKYWKDYFNSEKVNHKIQEIYL